MTAGGTGLRGLPTPPMLHLAGCRSPMPCRRGCAYETTGGCPTCCRPVSGAQHASPVATRFEAAPEPLPHPDDSGAPDLLFPGAPDPLFSDA